MARAFRAEILRPFPRGALADEFASHLESQAARKPGSSAAERLRGGIAARAGGNPLDDVRAARSERA